MSGRATRDAIAALAAAMERDVLEARFAAADGYLQRRDPRAVLGAALVVLLAVAVVHRPGVLAGLCLLPLAAAVASRVPLSYFAARTLLFVPLFSGVVALPALLEPVTPGPELLVVRFARAPLELGPLTLPATVAVTSSGVLVAARLVLRVTASVAVAAVVAVTQPWHRLLGAVARFGLPPAVVLTLAMTHRYLHVLQRLGHAASEARLARTVSEHGAGAPGVAAQVAWLLRRSLTAAERVEEALVSRGWAGRRPVGTAGRLAAADGVLLAATVTLAALAVAVDGMA